MDNTRIAANIAAANRIADERHYTDGQRAIVVGLMADGWGDFREVSSRPARGARHGASRPRARGLHGRGVVRRLSDAVSRGGAVIAVMVGSVMVIDRVSYHIQSGGSRGEIAAKYPALARDMERRKMAAQYFATRPRGSRIFAIYVWDTGAVEAVRS